MAIPQLRRLMGQQNGAPSSFDGSVEQFNDLSTTKKQEITKAMIFYIVAHPGDFTPQQVGVAQAESGRAATLDGTTGYDTTGLFSALGESFVDVVVQPLANVGNGISQTVSLIGKLIPWVVIGGLLVVAAPYIIESFRKVKSSTS